MSPARPTVLLADDHPIILKGLARLLSPDFEIAGAVQDGRALLEAAAVQRPNLVIVDISMPGIDGIEATRQLRGLVPEARVLILSSHTGPSWVHAAFAAGAHGYLTKTSPPEEVETAAREAVKGNFYISPAIAYAHRDPEGTVPPRGGVNPIQALCRSYGSGMPQRSAGDLSQPEEGRRAWRGGYTTGYGVRSREAGHHSRGYSDCTRGNGSYTHGRSGYTHGYSVRTQEGGHHSGGYDDRTREGTRHSHGYGDRTREGSRHSRGYGHRTREGSRHSCGYGGRSREGFCFG